MENQRPRSRSRARRPSRAVTIHDVAARAGVSVATVSRVLNRNVPVREETSRNVLDVARSLRYVPNVAARALSIRRSHTVGVVLPDVHGEFFSEVIRGVDMAARKAGYRILVSGSHSDAGEMLAVLEAMRGGVDGLIVMSPDVAMASLRDEIPRELPLVLMEAAVEGRDAINIDNYGGARAMTEHLASLGHTRIAFIRGPKQNADARERLRGYRQAMRRIGAHDGALEVEGEFTEESGRVAAKTILRSNRSVTAIFAANDTMAVGALSALREAGLDVPGDIALGGFDDIPIGRYVTPPLTTIHVDIDELGRRAFELVLQVIEQGGRREPRQECVRTSLVIRRSCGAAQQNAKTMKRPRGRKGGKIQ